MVAKKQIFKNKIHIYLKKYPYHCVSGSAGIDLALLDPYPYWDCGSGSRSKEIDQINLISILSQRLLFLRMYVLWPINYIKYLFHVNILWRQSLTKIRIRMHGSAWVLTWIRICNEVESWIVFQCGSTALDFCSANWENNLARVGNILERMPHTGRQTYSPSSTLSAITSKREVNIRFSTMIM